VKQYKLNKDNPRQSATLYESSVCGGTSRVVVNRSTVILHLKLIYNDKGVKYRLWTY